MPIDVSPRPPVPETYLGDGLYVRFDGHSIWLRAPRSEEGAIAMSDRREFILYAPVRGRQVYGSLADLDAAFDVACASNSAVVAETATEVNNQWIGRTHAYKLSDGRIFRRPLADWDTAEMVQT